MLGTSQGRRIPPSITSRILTRTFANVTLGVLHPRPSTKLQVRKREHPPRAAEGAEELAVHGGARVSDQQVGPLTLWRLAARGRGTARAAGPESVPPTPARHLERARSAHEARLSAGSGVWRVAGTEGG